MNKFAQRFLPYMLTLFLVPASFLSRSGVVLAQEQNVQIIELTARKYEYSPSPFHVKAGTRVQLKITTTDHDHGFKIPLVSRRRRTERQAWVGSDFSARLLAAQKGRNDHD
jgi:hypothetical protein